MTLLSLIRLLLSLFLSNLISLFTFLVWQDFNLFFSLSPFLLMTHCTFLYISTLIMRVIILRYFIQQSFDRLFIWSSILFWSRIIRSSRSNLLRGVRFNSFPGALKVLLSFPLIITIRLPFKLGWHQWRPQIDFIWTWCSDLCSFLLLWKHHRSF